MSSLKSFIKAVRAAKTIADERTVIQKESAAIRTSFREDFADTSIRRQNVAKLLYLFTLGERTHWGQVECLKLLASPRFTDKRLGYLGTMLLLDENQEVLTLVTNSLQSDLNHPNQYIVSLALCTLANIASTEMSRDLFADIEKILTSTNPYLRKKAALCAMRIIRKVPDLEEVYVEKARALLGDKNHGVLICGLAFITDLCLHNPDLISTFKKSIPVIIKHIKVLSTSSYVPEYDVSGIADPFLQVKLLRLLRILGAGDVQASEQMSDILAQIASNTDASKNVGNSVLYEAVQTIFGIEADSGLRVLGVNILGKFLTTKDNNTRYVALNTLLRVIDREPNAVQRHRGIIIECLQDSDISIRRRALELSYALINSQNVRVLVRELLSFLEICEAEFKPNLTSQIASAAKNYAPTKRWHIDTMIRMLKIAGSYAKENVLSSFIILVVGSEEELQLYAVQNLYTALQNDSSQQGLTLAGTWLIGEYGKLLLNQGSVSEEEITNELSRHLYSTNSTVVQQYVLDALMKLTTRLTSAPEIEKIRRILSSHSVSLEIEIQQRVGEYGKLFAYDSVRKGVLEKMPVPENLKDLEPYENEKIKKNSIAAPKKSSKQAASTTEDLLLDLMGDSTSSQPPSVPANNQNLLSDLFNSSSTAPVAGAPPAKSANQNIMDLFGSTGTSTPPTKPSAAPTNNLDDLLGTSGPTNGTSALSNSLGIEPIEAFNKGPLTLTFQPVSKEPGAVVIEAKFLNNGSSVISGLNLQIAVPKTQKLQLQNLSTSEISGGQFATQQLKISGSPGTNVRLRLRILYNLNGQDAKEQVDFGKFPTGLL